MKQSITFVHPATLLRQEVRVGPDHLLMAAGAVAALTRLGEFMSGTSVPWHWYALGAVVAHLGHLRHVFTLPVAASMALSLMSFGMSNLIGGAILNRWIAQAFRDGGWKIRNTDGELGEYSSRFLAVDKLGFHESDLMGAAHPASRQMSRDVGAAMSGWVDTVPQARRDSGFAVPRPAAAVQTVGRPVGTRQPDTVMG